MGRKNAHHQPRRCSGILEVENVVGLLQRADAAAMDAPLAFAEALDESAKLAADARGREHVRAFEEAGDARFAGRSKAPSISERWEIDLSPEP